MNIPVLLGIAAIGLVSAMFIVTVTKDFRK